MAHDATYYAIQKTTNKKRAFRGRWFNVTADGSGELARFMGRVTRGARLFYGERAGVRARCVVTTRARNQILREIGGLVVVPITSPDWLRVFKSDGTIPAPRGGFVVDPVEAPRQLVMK
jgi:hypothetical protein